MNRFAKFAIALGSVAVVATGAVAADDPVKDRKALMKTVGKNTKLSSQLAKGKIPYEAGQAETAMKTIAGVPDKYVTLFPEDSDIHPDTEASPKIWEDMAGFKAAAGKMKAAANAGAQAAGQGKEAFAAAFGNLIKTCKGCHESYRIKKQQ